MLSSLGIKLFVYWEVRGERCSQVDCQTKTGQARWDLPTTTVAASGVLVVVRALPDVVEALWVCFSPTNTNTSTK